MLAVLAALLGAFVLINTAQAQRVYHQGELDAILAPIALQPDDVVTQVLIAATYPEDVAAAARWSRANPHFRGEDAVRAVSYEPWDPAVKSLVAFPDLLLRMDESPQWLHDLGQAFLHQQAHVMDTVQQLRRRAQAAGYLSSSEQQTVYAEGQTIVVQPPPHVVYVRYYDPYVVYGPWWWPHYRPVFWRPWFARPVFVTHTFFHAKPDWHRRHVHVVHRPAHLHRHQYHQAIPGKWQHSRGVVVKPHVRVPEAQRKPIVQQHMPAASGFSREVRQPQGARQHDDVRGRREVRQQHNGDHGQRGQQQRRGGGHSRGRG
jgi:hypothetical protein